MFLVPGSHSAITPVLPSGCYGALWSWRISCSLSSNYAENLLKCANLISTKSKNMKKRGCWIQVLCCQLKKSLMPPPGLYSHSIWCWICKFGEQNSLHHSLWWPGTLEENVDWPTSMWNCRTRASSNKGFRFLSKWWQNPVLITVDSCHMKMKNQIENLLVLLLCLWNTTFPFSTDQFCVWIYIHSHLRQYEKAEDVVRISGDSKCRHCLWLCLWNIALKSTIFDEAPRYNLICGPRNANPCVL